jgi:Cu+-exporting ATPase
MAEAIFTLADAHTVCYHCGEDCNDGILQFDHKPFCCAGCTTVHELLDGNELNSYYELNANPGARQKLHFKKAKYSWLDDAESAKKLIRLYGWIKITIVSFNIPAIHCSSCIYLLENLYKINPAIVRTQVNFLQKEAKLTFKKDDISLREVVELIALIGYEPRLNMSDLEQTGPTSSNQHYYLK